MIQLDIEMPKSCDECPLRHYFGEFLDSDVIGTADFCFDGTEIHTEEWKDRPNLKPSWCPIKGDAT